ncbi:CBN-AQP-4 protein [Aphelenchoides bicaudatus]|nr:CBN-AQP-4 protein [Aphelenchoides bicaudatus]
MSLFMVPAYWAAQLLGGFVGSLIARASLQKEEFAQIGAGATLLSPGELWHQGLIVETMLTLILTQTVLNAAVDTSDNMLAPLAIGLTVALDIFSAGSISGASMNPARSLGPSIAGSIFVEGNGSVFWTYHYIYWAGPLLGATISAGVYRLLFSRGSRLIS